MRSLISVTLMVAGAFVSSSAVASTHQFIDAPNVLPTAIGHAQPRAG